MLISCLICFVFLVVVGGSELFVVCSLLFGVCCSLCVARRSLFVVCRLSFADCCFLFVVRCVLLGVCCLLRVSCWLKFGRCLLLFVV